MLWNWAVVADDPAHLRESRDPSTRREAIEALPDLVGRDDIPHEALQDS